MRHLLALPLVAALLLTGCLPQPAAFQPWEGGRLVDSGLGGQAMLAVTPRLAAGPGRTVLSLVAPYQPSDVAALRLELYTVDGSETLATTVDVPPDSIGNTITFSHLRYQTAYRLRAYAIDGSNAVISTPLAGTVKEITTSANQDDTPSPFILTVQLKDRPFNGQGTATGFSIEEGGYIPFGFVSTAPLPVGVNLAGPYGIARDDDGNLYIADTLNHCIRKITPAGVATVIGGTVGSAGYMNGNPSSFDSPRGVCFREDSNMLYVADTGNHAIRVIDTSNSNVTTLAGPTVAGQPGFADGDASTVRFASPQDLEVSREGHVLIADTQNHAIRVISPDNSANDSKFVTTLAGSDPAATREAGYMDAAATGARFNMPTSVISSDRDTLLVADSGNHRIRRIMLGDLSVTTFAGSGTPAFGNGNGTAAHFNGPTGLATDRDGNLYVADRYNHRIRKIAPDREVTTLAGKTASGAADLAREQASFNEPVDLEFLGDEASPGLLVVDHQNAKIRKIR